MTLADVVLQHVLDDDPTTEEVELAEELGCCDADGLDRSTLLQFIGRELIYEYKVDIADGRDLDLHDDDDLMLVASYISDTGLPAIRRIIEFSPTAA